MSQKLKTSDSILNDGKNKTYDFDILTNRELEIIKLAAQSYTNIEIADQLFIDEKTCIKHRENIYKKQGIKGKVEVRLFLRSVKTILLKTN